MYRKLIALAIAGFFSASAAAQSNVGLYGIVDLYATSGKIGDARFRGIESGGLSGSRLGFRGTEDLGNGLKVLFTIEYALSVDTSAAFTRTRQAFVGLEGAQGFVGLGRQYSPGYNISNAIDPFGASSAFSPLLLAQNFNYQGSVFPDPTSATIQGGDLGRFNNSLFYRSREMRGLQVQAMYAFGENEDLSNAFGNRRAGNFYGVGGLYRRGPLTLGAAYHHRKGTRFNFMGADAHQRDKREWFLGGRYDFGPAQVAASWQQVRSGVGISGIGNDNWRDRIWQVSGVVPITEAGSLLAGYAELDAEYRAEDVKIWTLAYTHSMSKRTTAYAGFRYVRNSDAAFSAAVPGLRINDQFGSNSQGLVLGVRHAF